MTASPLPMVNIAVPRILAEHFLTLCEPITDKMANAGCNDFPIHDTPQNRLLVEMAEAQNLGITLEEYRKHEDYWEPSPHAGRIYWWDFQAVHFFEHFIRKALEGKKTRG